jgi:hypothetical protein
MKSRKRSVVISKRKRFTKPRNQVLRLAGIAKEGLRLTCDKRQELRRYGIKMTNVWQQLKVKLYETKTLEEAVEKFNKEGFRPTVVEVESEKVVIDDHDIFWRVRIWFYD